MMRMLLTSIAAVIIPVGLPCAALASASEEVFGPVRARITDRSTTTRDPRRGETFRAGCDVELEDRGVLVRRFAVHVPDSAHLPFARRAGRFLALLWGMADRRFGRDCGRLRSATIDVWLTTSGQAGGELIATDLYFYDLSATRTGIEWARELAHEYGHYLLPSPSGYTEPEPWANGLLGERLFLSWLRDEVASNRLDAAELPFVTDRELADYVAKQSAPLVERWRESGPETALSRTDKTGMDAFSGLMLYADATYGSRSLMQMLGYLPRRPSGEIRAPDFLAALTGWLDAAPEFTVTLPGSMPRRVYLPAGAFTRTPGIGSAATGTSIRRARAGWELLAGAWSFRRIAS